DAVARISHYRVAHERGLHLAIRALAALEQAPDVLTTLELFRSEDECISYLSDWQQARRWRCGACGSTRRCWLKSRCRWECQCGQQHSVRHGTLFAKKHLP